MKTPPNKPSLEQSIMNNSLEAWRANKRRAHHAKAQRAHRHPIAESIAEALPIIILITASILLALIDTLSK